MTEQRTFTVVDMRLILNALTYRVSVCPFDDEKYKELRVRFAEVIGRAQVDGAENVTFSWNF